MALIFRSWELRRHFMYYMNSHLNSNDIGRKCSSRREVAGGGDEEEEEE